MDSNSPKRKEFTWGNVTPEERRARLDELGANENKTDNEWLEHNNLASLVAEDEELAAQIEKESQTDE